MQLRTVVLLVLAASAQGQPAADFKRLSDAYWQWRLQDAPEFASRIGVYDFNDQVEQFTIDTLDQRKANVSDFLAQLEKIDKSQLDIGTQISYDVLNDTLQTFIAGYKWKNYGPMNPVNFLKGLWTNTASVAPPKTETYDDFNDYVMRIHGWGDQARNYIKRMKSAIQEGTTNHWVSLNSSIQQLESMIGSSAHDSPMYKPFNETLDNTTLPESNKRKLREEALKALETFRQNFNELKVFILQEYKNATRKGYGVSTLPNGTEYYQACLKWHLSIDISPEEIHDKGLEEVTRIHNEMVMILNKLGFHGSTKEFFDGLSKNSSFIIQSPKETIQRFEYIINERIKSKLPMFFKNIPKSRLLVKEMPHDGPGGTYSFGSPDGSRPGVFYANVHRPEDNPTYNMVALALHEAVPGHHLQDIYAQASTQIPTFRKVTDFSKYYPIPLLFPFYTAYAEGWGLYAESLGEKDQLNIYENDYELMGRYGFEIFRACRLVVDTGLHHYNWTRDRAIEYLLNYTSLSRSAVTIEIDRYITFPGQATAYKIGELKIKELRKKSKDALGTLFDIRDFHSVILDNGAVPLSLLERLVNDWIDRVRATASALGGHPEDEFKRLSDDYWQWRLEDSPEFASTIGVHDFDNRVEQFAVDTLDLRKGNVLYYLAQLEKIFKSQLDKKTQISYDVLNDTLQTFIAGYAWKTYGPMNPVNFLEGLWTDAESVKPPDAATYVDFDNYLKRINGWADQAVNFVERMRVAIQKGTTNHWVSMNGSIVQLEDLIGSSPLDTPMYKPFNDTLDNTTIPESNKTALKAAALTALQQFRNNYETLKRFILQEYKNATRKGYGVGSLPNGTDYYKACLKWHLSIDISPEQIHSKGLEEVRRIHDEMITVMSRLGFHGSTKAFFENLSKNTSFFIQSPKDTIRRFENIINERIKSKLPMFFKNIPNSQLVVKEMPYDGPGGTYSFGSPDGSRPGVFYANVHRPEDNPTYNMVALALHEADPGHHLQDVYAQASTEIPTFRKVIDFSKYFTIPTHFPFYTAYAEGWGLYAESLGEKDQLDIYDNDYELMGRYGFEIFRACRLVVDTGLHHYNWSRDRAIEYMMNYTSLSRASVEIEINRYITWPGQATAYKIGELKIKELRQKSKDALGTRFDIRDFHSVILDNGAVPLSLLERLVDEWIEGVKAAHAQGGRPEDDFKRLSDEYVQWRLRDSPEFASIIGVHDFDDRVEQFAVDTLDQRKGNVTYYLTQLEKIDKSQLDKKTQISYDVLKDTLQTFIAGYEWKNYGPMNPVNFLEGLWTDTESLAPSNTATFVDFDNYLKRIDGWGDQAENFVKRMRVAIREGTTNHWISMNGSLEQLEGLIGSSPQDSLMYKPFNKTLDNTSIPESNKTVLRQAALNALSSFREKYAKLKQFILEEYKNATRKGYGVSSLPNGTEYYQACLNWHLSIDISPEQVHSKGLEEVRRINNEMVTVMNRLGFHGSTKEFFENISKNTSFFIQSPKETIQRFEYIINERIKSKLPLFFKNIPNSRLIIKEMPYDGPVGMYSVGSSDGSRPGLFYVNVHRIEDNPTYNMVALALHEADPGHHLNDVYAQASTEIPRFRKVVDYNKYFTIPTHFPFYTAYVEGWGLYAESLGEKDQLDIYDDDYELMGRYGFEIFRACRLVVDTGLHHYNWSRDRAIEYMMNYTSLSRASVEIEINRYITWPGQATAYKIGELKIKELRQKSKNALGTRFDIRDFHSVILDNGAVPLSLLERLVDEWIDEVKADTLEKIMTEFWEWRMKNSPEFSTSTQMYKFNDKLNSFSYEKFETDRVGAQEFLDRLHRLDRNSLPGDKKISFDILENMLETFLAGYKWKDYEPLNAMNFLEGWFVGYDLFVSSTPLDTQGDFVNYIRRLEQVPTQLEEIMNLSRRAIAIGHTSNNASVSRLPKQIDDMIVSDPELCDLYKPFLEHAETVFPDVEFRNSTQTRLKTAISGFMQKLKEVKEFLIREYMPKTRPGLGIGTLPNGTDNYKACLLFHTSVNITPEEVHQKGLEEVARIEKLIREKMSRVGFPSSTTILEMYNNLTMDKRFLIQNPAETLARFKSIIFERIQPLIPKYISNPPNLPLEVRASASDGIGGEYWTGSADGSRPGIFYCNLHKPEYNPTYRMVSLSLHEAIPGHHLAESFGILSDEPNFRKHFEWLGYNAPYFFPFYNAFAEGWALYAEFLGEEMGIYQDDYEMLGRYSDEMLRAVRLVVDSGIHYYNWTRQRAIDYMLNYTAETKDTAAIEIDRYATWPGQACGYKIGELKIKELRQKATTTLGNKFSLADFHHTILKNGAMPLNVLEFIIDDWIKTVKTSSETGHETSVGKDKINVNSASMATDMKFLIMTWVLISFFVN